MGDEQKNTKRDDWRRGLEYLKASIPSWYVLLWFVLIYGALTIVGDINDLADYMTQFTVGTRLHNHALPSLAEVIGRGVRYGLALLVAGIVAWRIGRHKLRRP